MAFSPLKVNMLILMSNDLNKIIDFYKNLGLELKFQVPEKWAEFDIQGIKLGIAYTNYDLPERRTGIVLEVDNLYDFYAQAKQQGVQFLGEPTQAIHGIIVSFKDPGNNIIDLYQPTPEKIKEMMRKAQEKECCKQGEKCACKQQKKDGCCAGH